MTLPASSTPRNMPQCLQAMSMALKAYALVAAGAKRSTGRVISRARSFRNICIVMSGPTGGVRSSRVHVRHTATPMLACCESSLASLRHVSRSSSVYPSWLANLSIRPISVHCLSTSISWSNVSVSFVRLLLEAAAPPTIKIVPDSSRGRPRLPTAKQSLARA